MTRTAFVLMVLFIVWAVTFKLTEPQTSTVKRAAQARHLMRSCVNDHGGYPVVETFWEQVSDDYRKPVKWKITCNPPE